MIHRPAPLFASVIVSVLAIGLGAWLMLTPAPPAPNATRVEAGESGLTFVIENLTSAVEPELALFSETDLKDFLRPGEGRNSRFLPNLALSKFPAVLLSYQWDLGEEQVKGEYLYVHKDYRYPWKVLRDGDLTVYYADKESVEWKLEKWVAHNEWIAGFLGATRKPVTVYAMPDEESYSRIIKGYSQLGGAAAFWNDNLKWVVLRPGYQVDERVIHELAHAYLLGGRRNPIWWEEGAATWVEAHFLALAARQTTWFSWQSRLLPLAERAAREPVALAKVTQQSPAPLDPYLVGFSLFAHLEQRYGAEKVKQLLLAASKRPLEEAFPQVLGQSLNQVLEEWQKALQSGELLNGVLSWAQ